MPESRFSASPEIPAWPLEFAARGLILLTGVEGSLSRESSAAQLPETTVRARRNQGATPWARRSEPDAYSENPGPDGCRRTGIRLSSRNRELADAASSLHPSRL